MSSFPVDGTASLADQLAQCQLALTAAQAQIAALQQEADGSDQPGATAFVQQLPTAGWLLSADGRTQALNQAFRTLLGCAAEPPLPRGPQPAGADTSFIAEAFEDPAAFRAWLRTTHRAGTTSLHQAFALADGRVVELDYLVLESTSGEHLIVGRDITERHQHLAQLRTRAHLLEQHPQPVVQLSSRGEVRYANRAAAALLAAAPDALQREAGPRLLRVGRRAWHSGQPQELILAGHSYRVAAVAGPEEEALAVYLTAAPRQQSQEENFYESILAHVPAGVIAFDAQHRYLYANPVVEPDPALRAWLIGKNNFESCARRGRPRAMAERRQALFEQALRERQEVTWEETLWYPQLGKRHHLRRFRPLFAADGSLRMVLSLGIDITERQQAEAALREHQYLVQQIVDTIPNLLCVINPANEVVFANAAFRQFFQSRGFNRPKHPDHQRDFDQFCAWNRQVLETGQVFRREISLTAEDGEVRYFQTDKRPLQRADGRLEVLTLHTDITARVAAEQEAQQAKQQAEENAQAKEMFLSRMSHEIRTPLNGVLGMALLLEKTSLTAQQQGYLTTMQQAGHQLLLLINDVLDLTKITSRPLPLAQAPFDVLSTLRGAQQTVGALATLKGLPVTIEADALSGLSLVGDAARLHQVLLNLLGNAIKFTEQGGIQLGATVVRGAPEDVTIRFWVQDTGIGIAAEEQEAIFEAFSQVNAVPFSALGGTGLGLAISDQLVRQMGSVLRLSSTPGEGSTFFFGLTLPRSEPTAAPLPAEPPRASYEELRGLHILLAEDNLVNQWITRVILEQRGVVVDVVAHGVAALEALEAQPYDAAVLDIQMPGLSGLEVTRAFRQRRSLPHVNLPIIALTANAFEADQATYLAAGMNGCVTKPFAEEELCQLLLRLTRPQPAAE
ncbi:PAS domain-containing hybrid sensor histidine kinase/response regulator [Hymenobacter wooponensis]|uniref:histidine kinase n=1 Tax=Hymenobacter wooponensis TaxID=1525360 RepID=A0A4Z0MDJ5_9BACT|nr:PAS domain-containing hybrid sensor histidine kinase/response regulator [Hymenobacter wooponensis]TGD77581.1 PAS domain-containing sensor histidine kinase [Hymenobacter wooponensis]